MTNKDEGMLLTREEIITAIGAKFWGIDPEFGVIDSTNKAQLTKARPIIRAETIKEMDELASGLKSLDLEFPDSADMSKAIESFLSGLEALKKGEI